MTNHSKRWIKFLYIFLGCTAVIATLTVSALGVGVASCSYTWSKRDAQFGTIAINDPKETVLAKMGKPSYKEGLNEHSHRYASYKCSGNCHERIWYEAKWCLDSAWAIEFNEGGKVIDKYEIKSP